MARTYTGKVPHPEAGLSPPCGAVVAWTPLINEHYQMSDRIRILSLSTVFPNPTEPGCGIFVSRRLEALASLPDGPEVKVLAPIQVMDYGNWRHRFWRASGVVRRRQQGPLDVRHLRWWYPPMRSILNPPCLFARVLPACLRLWWSGWRFDVIDAHFGHPEGVVAALLGIVFRRPFLVTMRGNERDFARIGILESWQQWAFGRSARMIAVAEPLRRFAIGLGAAEPKVVTIPNGVDATLFRPLDRAVCRAKLGIAAEAPVLLSVGYLVEPKGHHDIVRALARLRAAGRGAPVELVIAGGPGREGDFEPELRRIIADSGMADRVRMTGAVSPPELAEWMNAADLLCLASYSEGWPNVVLEALACGTPVIATNVGGVPEMITAADYGIIVAPRDDKALEQAIEEGFGREWDRAKVAEWGGSRGWEQVAREVWSQVRAVVG